jgi:hypothetical protein
MDGTHNVPPPRLRPEPQTQTIPVKAVSTDQQFWNELGMEMGFEAPQATENKVAREEMHYTPLITLPLNGIRLDPAA